MPATLIGPCFEALSRHNVLLHARARRHSADVASGPFSVKGVVAGEVVWRVGGDRFRVDPTTQLVLDRGEGYALDIDEARPVETFVVFFADELVGELGGARLAGVEALLDDPSTTRWLPITRRLWTGPTRLAAGMRALRALVARGAEQGELDLGLRGMLDACGDLAAEVVRERDRIAAARASTREELHRRVLLGKAHLDRTYDGPFDLRATAKVACMAPHHFHRTFAAAIGRAPYAYVAARRIERARVLVEETDEPVVDVCGRVGYESFPSFVRAFRHRVGSTPGAHRVAFRNRR